MRDVDLKINRAEQHIRDVQLALTRFFASNPYTIAVRHHLQTGQPIYYLADATRCSRGIVLNEWRRIAQSPKCARLKQHPQTGQAIYYLADARDVPVELSLMSGDALHNLRSALDYLACALVTANGETPTRNTGFPILREAPASPKDERFARKVKGMKQAAIDTIWDIKPYRGGDKVLWLLHSLDNIDKHRLLVALGHYFIDFGSAHHLEEIKPSIPRGPAPRFVRYNWIGTKHLKVGDDGCRCVGGCHIGRSCSLGLGKGASAKGRHRLT